MLLIAITDKGYLPLGEAFSLDEAIELLPGYLRAANEAGHQVSSIEAWLNRNGAYRLAIVDTEEINKRAGLSAASAKATKAYFPDGRFRIGDLVKWKSQAGPFADTGTVCAPGRLKEGDCHFGDKTLWAVWIGDDDGKPRFVNVDDCTLISRAEASHEA